LRDAVNLIDRAQIDQARGTLDLLPERARLLAIDTMARAMAGGDENSARDPEDLVFVNATGGVIEESALRRRMWMALDAAQLKCGSTTCATGTAR
jgi:hypothetical protein